MGRPREFDESAALDAAVDCFWTHGYEAASVRDLADRMGITGASLYNAFGDKRALYRRALDHYLDHTVRDRITRLEGALSPRDAIDAYLREVIERSLDDRKRRGCLLVNSALEASPSDASMRRVVAEEMTRIEAFFLRCTRAALGPDRAHDAEDIARLLLGALMGIRVLARTRPQRVLLEGIVRPVLAMLEPTTSSTSHRARPARAARRAATVR